MELSLLSFEVVSVSLIMACGMTALFTLYGLPLCVGLYSLCPIDSKHVFKRRFTRHLLLFAAVMHCIGLISFVFFVIFFVNAIPSLETFLQDPIALAQAVIFCLLALCAVCAFLIARRKTSVWIITLLALFWTFFQTLFVILFEFDNYYTIISQIVLNADPNIHIGIEPILAEFTLFLQLNLSKAQALFFLVRGILFACMSACALAMVWLVIRRKADDFGRDYYTYAARLAARLAMLAAIALCAFELHVLFWYPDFVQGDSFALYISIGAQALGACIWFFVQASATPMRHKVGMWCGAVCVLCATIVFIAV